MDRTIIAPEELRRLGELRHAYEGSAAGDGHPADIYLVECAHGDLSGLDLCGIVGVDSVLPDISFRGADLSIAMLHRMEAPRANFDDAVLVDAELDGARLAFSSFVGANLFKAKLRNADLRNADLRNADLRCSSFAGADLRGARIEGARLDQHTIFTDARLDFDPNMLTRE